MDQLIVRYDFLEATFRTVMHLINKARHEAIDFLFHRFWYLFFNHFWKSFVMTMMSHFPVFALPRLFMFRWATFVASLFFFVLRLRFIWGKNRALLLFKWDLFLAHIRWFSFNIEPNNFLASIHLLHCVNVHLVCNHHWVSIFIFEAHMESRELRPILFHEIEQSLESNLTSIHLYSVTAFEHNLHLMFYQFLRFARFINRNF